MPFRSTRIRLRDRSIALMHVLLLLSGVALLASAIALSLLLGAVVHRQASSDLRSDLSHATSVVLASSRVADLLTKPAAAAAISKQLLHNPNVAKDLQAQPNATFLRRNTLFAVPRGTVDGCGKRCITSATASTMGYRDSLTLIDQIRQNFLRDNIRQDGAQRDEDGNVQSVAPVLVASSAWLSSLGSECPLFCEELKARVSAGSCKDDVATSATLTAVRPAFLYILLTAEAHCSVSAVSRGDSDYDLIENAVS